jgi:hypothetical protein
MPFEEIANRVASRLFEEISSPTQHPILGLPERTGEHTAMERLTQDVNALASSSLANKHTSIEDSFFAILAEILTMGGMLPTNFDGITSITNKHRIQMNSIFGRFFGEKVATISEDEKKHQLTKNLPISFSKQVMNSHIPDHPFTLLSVYGRSKTLTSIFLKVVSKQPELVANCIAIYHAFFEAAQEKRPLFYPAINSIRDAFKKEVQDIIALTYITQVFNSNQESESGLNEQELSKLRQIEQRLSTYYTETPIAASIQFNKKDTNLVQKSTEFCIKKHKQNWDILEQMLIYNADPGEKEQLINLVFSESLRDQQDEFFIQLISNCSLENLNLVLTNTEIQANLLPVEYALLSRVYFLREAGYSIDKINDYYYSPKDAVNTSSSALNSGVGYTGFQIKYTHPETKKTSEIQIRDSISWLGANHPHGDGFHKAYKSNKRKEAKLIQQTVREGVLKRLAVMGNLAKDTLS